jgi:peptidoglycan-N-acetylglucosamine deacetylase
MYKAFVHILAWVQRLMPQYVWTGPADGKVVYLTFDDGPHPEITPWVMAQLERYNAKATFFCIGNNVRRYEDVYRSVINAGHAVGNHTYNHANGWKVSRAQYAQDIVLAAKLIDSNLFRPPYGKLRPGQWKEVKGILGANTQVVLWDVLTGDFDKGITPQQCARNVLTHVKPGSIVVFHDSEKANKNLVYALPLVLEKLSAEGYRFEALKTAGT